MARIWAALGAVAIVWTGCSSPGPEKQAQTKAAPVAYFKPDPATVGKISGKAVLSGKKPARKRINIDDDDCKTTQDGPLFAEDFVAGAKGELANVFVHVKSGLEGRVFEPAKVAVKFDQRGCAFRPHVTALRVGQTFEINNADKVTHNIHPMPRENREWNQGQPSGAPPIEREFTKPEIGIAVKCNVHAWMRAYVHVVEHPYFAVTGVGGSFEIANLPPGEYTVEAWHEKLPAQTAKIAVAASGTTTAEFTFKGE